MESKQNFHQDVEDGINSQIINELSASYVYLAMSNYCRRTEISLPGATQYFLNQSYEERQHAQKLIEYQNDRGGMVELLALKAPPKQEWSTLFEMFKDALDLEKSNNKALLELHVLASEKNDPDVSIFLINVKYAFLDDNLLEEFYLREQVYEIREMASKCATLKRIGEGLAVHLFDQQLLKELKKDD